MRLWLLTFATLLALFAGCSIPREETTPAPAEVLFSSQDRQRLVAFYAAYDYPPALAEPESLAPGLEERMERSAKVPPDIAGIPLPAELEQTLTPLPPGYVRFRAGDAVYLMDVRLRQVVDVVAIEFR